MQELQDEYEQLRQQKEEQSSRAVVQYSQTDDEDDQEDTSTKALYERLTALKISLREENVAMKKTVKEYERFYERMQHIARSDQDQVHLEHMSGFVFGKTHNPCTCMAVRLTMAAAHHQ